MPTLNPTEETNDRANQRTGTLQWQRNVLRVKYLDSFQYSDQHFKQKNIKESQKWTQTATVSTKIEHNAVVDISLQNESYNIIRVVPIRTFMVDGSTPPTHWRLVQRALVGFMQILLFTAKFPSAINCKNRSRNNVPKLNLKATLHLSKCRNQHTWMAMLNKHFNVPICKSKTIF